MSVEAMKKALTVLNVAAAYAEHRQMAEFFEEEAKDLRQAIELAEKQEYSKRHNCPHCEREFACNHHEWVGLTDDEIKEIIGPWGDTPIKGYTRELFDKIEAKLKEKNRG